MALNIGDVCGLAAQTRDKTALRLIRADSSVVDVSFGEMDARASQFANVLRDMGEGKWEVMTRCHGRPRPGEYLELEPYSRIVHVARMHLPDPTPDNHVETRFDPDGAGTLMTMRMTLPDAQTRATMLTGGMERGMEASYVRLEGLNALR